MTNTGALIVATPAADDPINEYSQESYSHVTMVWFGEAEDLPEDLLSEVRASVVEVAGRYGPFDVHVSGVGLIGPDKASVLLLESEDLVDIRNDLCASPAVRSAWMMAEHQFPWWVCHTTVRYDGVIPEDPPNLIRVDALALWVAEVKTPYPLVGEGDSDDEEEEEDPLISTGVTIPPILTLHDLKIGLRHADTHPSSRWYVKKRAVALGAPGMIPEQWTGPVS